MQLGVIFVSNNVLILGPSGSGKSTSIRTLDSESTYILNVLGKPLPFRGYKKKYNLDQKNYYETDDWTRVVKCIQVVNLEKPHIKTLVIDDLQHVLSNEFMRRIGERGFDKFNDFAFHFWKIIMEAKDTRDDLVCVFMIHNEIDDTGMSKVKTVGKLTDKTVSPDSTFTTILHSNVRDGEYSFITQNDGFHLAKSPIGMFEEKNIPNDLKFVRDTITNYFNDGENE